MQYPGIDMLLAARRIGGRDEFYRRTFDLMMHPQLRHGDPPAALFADPALTAILARWIAEAPVKDEMGMLRLLAVRRALRSLSQAAGQSFGALVAGVLALDAAALADPRRLPEWKQVKLAALADPALLTPAALDAWQAGNPMLARIAAIAILDSCPLDAERARAAGAIGRWLVTAAPVAMPPLLLDQLQMSAFFVSYLDDPDCHAFKRAIVRQAAFIAAPLGERFAAPRERAPGPLRLTIVGEKLSPLHAMFRCYADILATLKQPFEVTLVAEQSSRCDEHALFSHRQLYLPDEERELARLAGLVASTRPDIVLYPSIGMSYATFALSLLRLAPLQLMSVGHPAPSCSEAIDGTLVYRELAASPEPEYGPILAYDQQTLPAPPAGGWQADVAAAAQRAPMISVNAAAMKLAPPFLALVRELLDTAPPGTGLQFFPNLAGDKLAALRRELARTFPAALVHPNAGYRDYMGALARSTVVLQSFPFGGTNTTMDALALGIPIVCLECPGIASATDPVILRAAGMDGACVRSKEDYLALARRMLVSGDDQRRFRAAAALAFGRLAALPASGSRTLADAVVQAWNDRAKNQGSMCSASRAAQRR